ncbi:MAG: response regulator transcription factor [Cyanobacteria bacterium]|nr:response regulator transcription factor [Cyanobacteriota bacterium]
MDFTDRLDQLEPNRRMMSSWILSSGIRLSFVIAMKSRLGLMGIARSISVQSRIKGVASTEEEALLRIRQSSPGLLICSDQLEQGDGFSLCRRAIQEVGDLKVLMVLSSEDSDVGSALDSGAMAVVCEEDFLSPEMEVMQSLLAAANNKHYVSSLARSRMQKPESIVESPQSLTQREKEVLILMLKGATDRDISEHLLISVHTVKEYGKSIRRKYNVKSRLQLISVLLGR